MAGMFKEWQAIVTIAIAIAEEQVLTDAEKRKAQSLLLAQRVACFSKRDDFQMVDPEESIVTPRINFRFYGSSGFSESCAHCGKKLPVGSEIWQRSTKPKWIVCDECFSKVRPAEYKRALGIL